MEELMETHGQFYTAMFGVLYGFVAFILLLYIGISSKIRAASSCFNIQFDQYHINSCNLGISIGNHILVYPTISSNSSDLDQNMMTN